MMGNAMDWLGGALVVFALAWFEVLAYTWPVWSWLIEVVLLWKILKAIRLNRRW